MLAGSWWMTTDTAALRAAAQRLVDAIEDDETRAAV